MRQIYHRESLLFESREDKQKRILHELWLKILPVVQRMLDVKRGV